MDRLQQKTLRNIRMIERLIEHEDYYLLVLTLIFYKQLSNQFSQVLDSKVQKQVSNEVGCFISEEYYFEMLMKKIENQTFGMHTLKNVAEYIEKNTLHQHAARYYENIFNEFKDHPIFEKEEHLKYIIETIEFIHMYDGDLKVLFDKVLEQYAFRQRREFEISLPQSINILMAEIVTIGQSKMDIYNPKIMDASSLLAVGQTLYNNGGKVLTYYGEETNQQIYRIACMNMIMHGINYRDFEFSSNQRLNMKFDAIITSLVTKKSSERLMYSRHLSNERKYEDLNMLSQLMNQLSAGGTMVVVLPQNLLYLTYDAYKTFREYMIKELNIVDTIIELPHRILFNSSTQPIILVLKKNRVTKDVLFIDATIAYNKTTSIPTFNQEQQQQIIDTYKDRKIKRGFSNVVTIEQIENHQYDLTLAKYIEAEEVKEVTMSELKQEQLRIEAELKRVTLELQYIFKR